MITVKFFGLLSLAANTAGLQALPGTGKEVMEEILRRCPELNREQLHRSLMVVNRRQISGRKRFSIILRDGDEVVFLSPASGG